MNLPNVTAPPREYAKPAPREARKLEESSEVDDTNADSGDDGTRSVQDLIAAALKMFANPEPKLAPVVEVPIVDVAPKLEQAVQRVLDQIIAKQHILDQLLAKPVAKTPDDESSSENPSAETTTPDAPVALSVPQIKTDAPLTSKGPVATTAVREPAPLPENSNPSHVHLVLDDGPERVVVTVAVRGNEVNATIRGGDEQTAAAIARNAASLDHALRTNGMDLSSFTAERDLEHRERPPQQQNDEEETA